MSRAPVALFVFRRPDHAARTIAALKANPGFAESPVHVFADGPRSAQDEDAVAETRRVVTAQLPDAVHHFAHGNRGLARSLSGGAKRLAEEFGRVIVVEDDLLVAEDFLDWMNAALDRYAGTPSVMQVSAHLPGPGYPGRTSSLLLPFTTSWGWGSWDRVLKGFDLSGTGAAAILDDRALRRRFDLGGAMSYSKMLERQLAGQIDSWAILFYAKVFLANGAVAFPPVSRVRNIGFDGSGTHGSMRASRGDDSPPRALPYAIEFPQLVEVEAAALAEISRAAGQSVSIRNALGKLMSRLRRVGSTTADAA